MESKQRKVSELSRVVYLKKRNIKRPTIETFQDVVLRSDLDIHIPTIKDLPPEIIFEMWQKMPNTTLSKEKIFTGAVALCIDYLANESKK